MVLAGGLLWPGGESGEAAEGHGAPSRTAPESARAAEPATADETAGAPSPTPAAEDLGTSTPASDETAVTAAASLLIGAASCAEAGASSCPDVIAEGSTVDVVELGEIAGSEPAITPVDEYGDVAVIRAESSTAPRILVLVRMNEKWLVRDVYDVADQPS